MVAKYGREVYFNEIISRKSGFISLWDSNEAHILTGKDFLSSRAFSTMGSSRKQKGVLLNSIYSTVDNGGND